MEVLRRWWLVATLVLLGGPVGETSAQPPAPAEPPALAQPLTADERARYIAALRDPSRAPEERETARRILKLGSWIEAAASAVEPRPTSVSPSAETFAGAWDRVPAPTERADHTAIHDPLRQRMIVFGGEDWWTHSYFDDTHALSLGDDSGWTPLPLAPFGPIFGHSAIYDPVRERMLVFGGIRPGGGASSHVWALSLGDVPTWTRLEVEGAAPSGRWDHVAIHDPVRDRMLVFGGGSSDVWALSLAGAPTWHRLEPSGEPPSGRSNHTAIHDPLRERMIVFGGGDWDDPDRLWALTLSESPVWSEIAPSGEALPIVEGDPAAIYDPVRDRMVIFRPRPSRPRPGRDRSW
jgi:hypothetical protein